MKIHSRYLHLFFKIKMIVDMKLDNKNLIKTLSDIVKIFADLLIYKYIITVTSGRLASRW